MNVSIGLPNTIAGTTGPQLVEWARRAEDRGFTSLGTIDRVLYDNYEPLIALASVAGATERIGLTTSILIGPLHASTAMLAKQTLSLHAVSGERLTLGIGLGTRDDDYEFAGLPVGKRGEQLDEMLDRVRDAWANELMGPSTASFPTILVGGFVNASFTRAAEYGDGWLGGGLPPQKFAEAVANVRSEFSRAGRGDPKIQKLSYFSLGENAEQQAFAYLTDYYAWLGEDTAARIAGSAAKDAQSIKEHLCDFEASGCEEVIFYPCSNDPDQVDMLGDAVSL